MIAGSISICDKLLPMFWTKGIYIVANNPGIELDLEFKWDDIIKCTVEDLCESDMFNAPDYIDDVVATLRGVIVSLNDAKHEIQERIEEGL